MTVLIIVAHPDDEILGCGGTAARLAKEGHEIYTLILGEGITSRFEKRSAKKAALQIKKIREMAVSANKIIGVKKVFFCGLPDNRFDSCDLLDIVRIIEKKKEEVRPDIIFTHYEKDLNIDHQITYKAVITATRPTEHETVREIYASEVLSSTEWNFPLSFFPDVFFGIQDTLDLKLKALGIYKSEIRSFPYPRSPEGVKYNAAVWGMKTGLRYAEAFKCVRVIK